MRVLHVIPGLSPRFGGPSNAVLGMCKELSDRGIEVEVATTNADVDGTLDVPLGRPVSFDGVTVYFFDSPLLRRYGFSWGLTAWLRARVHAYHVVHLHGLFAHVTGPLGRYARRHRVPYIVRPCGELGTVPLEKSHVRKRLYWSLVGRRCVNGARALHLTSEEERRSAQRFAPRTPCVVVPLGVAPVPEAALPPRGEFRRAHPEVEGKKLIVFLSRLDPIKGLDRLLRACGLLAERRDDFALVIAGSEQSSYAKGMRDLAFSGVLSGRVAFTGFVQGVEKLALLRDADLFVLPSYHENFGMAVVEAMAARIPVVISDQVGVHREVAEGGAGLVTGPTFEEIAAALASLLDDDALRQKMGERGERLVQERFSLEKVADGLIGLYESILSSGTA